MKYQSFNISGPLSYVMAERKMELQSGCNQKELFASSRTSLKLPEIASRTKVLIFLVIPII